MTDDKLKLANSIQSAIRTTEYNIKLAKQIVEAKPEQIAIVKKSGIGGYIELDEGETVVVVQTLLPMLEEKLQALQAEYDSF